MGRPTGRPRASTSLAKVHEGIEELFLAVVDRAKLDALKGDSKAIEWLIDDCPEYLSILVDVDAVALSEMMGSMIKRQQVHAARAKIDPDWKVTKRPHRRKIAA